jgi:hypothetical protein
MILGGGDNMAHHNRTYQEVELSDARVGDSINLSDPIVPVRFEITGRNGDKVTIQSSPFTVDISDVDSAYGYRGEERRKGYGTVRRNGDNN